MRESETARQFWDREAAGGASQTWLSHLLVRHYVNSSISGQTGGWPLDWFQRTYPDRRFRRALSVGCGTGALERDLLRRGLCESIDAVDVSEVSLQIARQLANGEGLGGAVAYRVADFNRLTLPASSYDLVLFHQSLHHVSRLERLLRHVRRSLRPGGLLYLDEFVGPSRTYWSEARIAWYRALYQLIPRPLRYFDEFQMPVQYEDLSEAVRSGEIMSRVRIGFDVQHVRGYGGNILAMMFPDLDVPRLSDELVALLVEAERSLLASGVEPFYAVVVAEPRRGLAAALAEARYLAAPKLNRLRRELAVRVGGEGARCAPEESRFRV